MMRIKMRKEEGRERDGCLVGVGYDGKGSVQSVASSPVRHIALLLGVYRDYICAGPRECAWILLLRRASFGRVIISLHASCSLG